MITISLYSLLFAYFAFLILFAVFAAVNLSHLFHTGALTFTSFVITIIMGVVVLLIFYATWYLLQDINWQAPLTVWNSGWFGSSGNIY